MSSAPCGRARAVERASGRVVAVFVVVVGVGVVVVVVGGVVVIVLFLDTAPKN